jgi:hypothetical protein
VLGNRANPISADVQAPGRLDTFSYAVLEGVAPYGEAGRLQRFAPGAEMVGHARAARPVWMLAHPFPLRGPRGVGLSPHQS